MTHPVHGSFARNDGFATARFYSSSPHFWVSLNFLLPVGDVSNRDVLIHVRTHACVYEKVYVSDICALTFKGAALTEEEAECDYRSGKRKNVGGRRKKEQPRANRFKLPSTSHSRFQLEACLFPFWVFRGLALYARCATRMQRNKKGAGGDTGEYEKRERERGEREREREREREQRIAGVDYQWTIEQHPPPLPLICFLPVH